MTTPTPPFRDPTSIHETGVWVRSPEVASVGDSATRFALVDLASPSVAPRILSASAAVVWGTIAAPRTTDEIVSLVAEHYAAAPAELRTDVTWFLAELTSQGLVVRQAPAGAAS